MNKSEEWLEFVTIDDILFQIRVNSLNRYFKSQLKKQSERYSELNSEKNSERYSERYSERLLRDDLKADLKADLKEHSRVAKKHIIDENAEIEFDLLLSELEENLNEDSKKEFKEELNYSFEDAIDEIYRDYLKDAYKQILSEIIFEYCLKRKKCFFDNNKYYIGNDKYYIGNDKMKRFGLKNERRQTIFNVIQLTYENNSLIIELRNIFNSYNNQYKLDFEKMTIFKLSK